MKVNCLECKRSFDKYPHEVNRSPNHFCSHSCNAKYQGPKRRALVYCLHCKAQLYKGRKFCSHNCRATYNYETYIARWKNGLETGSQKSGCSDTVRRYMLEETNNHCSKCAISKWNGQQITMEIDHIDGNHQNNLEKNLRVLCPNCHSLAPNYRAKNKGNGRAYRLKNGASTRD